MTTTLPEGFRIYQGWANALEMTPTVDAIRWEQTQIRMFGKSIDVPRLTSWMGDGAYTYSGIRHVPSAMPDVVGQLRQRLDTLTGVRFNSVLANLYRSGNDSVSWHADDEPELGAGPVIASLSLGSAREFRIRENATGIVTKLVLGHGDLLVMSGRAQADYQHAVPKTRKAVGPRCNLTFRVVSC